MRRKLLGLLMAVVMIVSTITCFGGNMGQVNASPAEGMELYWISFSRYDNDGTLMMKTLASCATSGSDIPIKVTKDGTTEYVTVDIEKAVSTYGLSEGYSVTGFIINGT